MAEQKINMGIRGIMQGSMTDKIYKFIVKKKAVIRDEVLEEFPELKPHHVPSYLKQIQKQGFIVKSKTRAQSLKRKCSGSFVWGTDEEAVSEKLYQLSKKVNKKELLTGIKKAISDIVANSETAFTLAEVLYELREMGMFKDYVSYDYIYTCLRELIKDGIIKRSQFKMPDTAMIYGRKPGYIYGRDFNAIAKKTIDMMPPEIRDAFLMIRQSNELFTIDSMEERFKVTYEQVKSWFDYRACTVGWLKVYSYKMRRYYHSPTLNQKYVEESAPKIHENQIVKTIFNTMNLGVEFEKQVIFYWVMYLTHRYGIQIRLNDDFPQRIPSWFNPKDLEKYTEGGEKDFKINVDVWKFDSEPIDYLIFCYDDILKVPITGYAISMKKDHKSHMIGNAGKRYIAELIGCISKGHTLDLKHIPAVNSLTPLLVMDNPNGIKLFEWARKYGCVLLYSKNMEKIIEYLNDIGLKYENDMKLSDYRQYKELLLKYKDHRDVIIGKLTPEDLVRLKRQNGRTNGTDS